VAGDTTAKREGNVKSTLQEGDREGGRRRRRRKRKACLACQESQSELEDLPCEQPRRKPLNSSQ